MKKDWRQTKWKDFSSRQKGLLILLCAELFAVLFAALFFPYWGIEIPGWAAIPLLVVMLVSLYKFLNITPWAAAGFEDEEADNDDDETDTAG